MQSMSHWYEVRPGSRYVLMGLRSFLNAPGEWWYDAQNRRLRPSTPHTLSGWLKAAPEGGTVLLGIRHPDGH